MQQNTLIKSIELQDGVGSLKIQDAEEIHSLVVQNEDSKLSMTFDVKLLKELVIFLSKCDTNPLSFTYCTCIVGDGSKLLTINICAKAFHIDINGKFHDINLEIQPKVENNTVWRRHPWYNY